MLPASRHVFPLVVAAALAAAGAVVAPATAQEQRPEARGANNEAGVARNAPRMQANGRSLSDAVRRVQRETGGRILGAERVPYDGRDINRVKYMDDRGRVRYMDDPSPPVPRGSRRADPPPRGDNS
ncbi:PepSY domain-containing protein [Stenotrophomonas pictorum]